LSALGRLVGVPGLCDREEVAQVSDERKNEEELESEDDVEAHTKLKQATSEGSDDDGDDVEAHTKLKQ
jgi:hypothetical protein